MFSTYAVATAAKVPMEMSCEGFLRSPLILIPAMTPVNAGKNTPNTLNQSWLSVYPGLLLFFHTVIFHPWNPSSVIQWINGFSWTSKCNFYLHWCEWNFQRQNPWHLRPKWPRGQIVGEWPTWLQPDWWVSTWRSQRLPHSVQSMDWAFLRSIQQWIHQIQWRTRHYQWPEKKKNVSNER